MSNPTKRPLETATEANTPPPKRASTVDNYFGLTPADHAAHRAHIDAHTAGTEAAERRAKRDVVTRVIPSVASVPDIARQLGKDPDEMMELLVDRHLVDLGAELKRKDLVIVNFTEKSVHWDAIKEGVYVVMSSSTARFIREKDFKLVLHEMHGRYDDATMTYESETAVVSVDIYNELGGRPPVSKESGVCITNGNAENLSETLDEHREEMDAFLREGDKVEAG